MNKILQETNHPLALVMGNVSQARLRRRHRAERRFRWMGATAILLAFGFLLLLLWNIFSNGVTAFVRTEIRVPIVFQASVIDPHGEYQSAEDVAVLQRARTASLVREGMILLFPDETQDRRQRREIFSMVSKGADDVLREQIIADPTRLGLEEEVWLPAASFVDMVMKGNIDRKLPESRRSVKDRYFHWLDRLEEQGRLRTVWNGAFWTNGDSREPELAGIWGAFKGSMFIILVCMALAFPIGVAAAIYLEEFARKNWLTDVIEVSINNLAAVPSIVYGLLALAVFLQMFGLGRSTALVGGLALSLLVLPTMIIATRNALKSVPPSIRDAGRALGASPLQVLAHHTLPLAMPGIMTGAILSVARAVGETAPLLMIGMVAFVVDVPQNVFDKSTALPVQIYLWADSPEAGFSEKTSAAIVVLLMFLVLANLLAVVIRRKFERTW